MIVLIDGKTYEFGLQEHPGEQFIFVVEGSMDYIVGDKKYSLGPEDCLYHGGHAPHGPRAFARPEGALRRRSRGQLRRERDAYTGDGETAACLL